MYNLINTSYNNENFIHVYTLCEAHNLLLKFIKKYGNIVYIKYNYKNVKTLELENVNSIIEYPENTEIPLTTKWNCMPALKAYADEIITDKIPEGFTYTYGSLIYHPINQVEKVINILSKDLYSRQATMMLGNANCLMDNEPPCCRIVDFKFRNNKLNMNLLFRSHDITAYYPNLWAFHQLQKIIANKLSVNSGAIRCTSESLHLYEGDFNLLGDF